MIQLKENELYAPKMGLIKTSPWGEVSFFEPA